MIFPYFFIEQCFRIPKGFQFLELIWHTYTYIYWLLYVETIHFGEFRLEIHLHQPGASNEAQK